MVAKEISEKMVRTHALLVLPVCTLFGIVSLVRKEFLMGALTIGAGILIQLIVLVFMKGASKIARGTFITLATVVVIAGLSAAQGELHGMFAMFAANIAIGSVYYDLKNVKYALVLTDIILVAACFLKDMFYQGVGISLVIKGILGVNIAAVMVIILLRDAIKSINDAVEATNKADALLIQVNDQVEETRVMAEKQ
ncbi:MAG: hypothetical protein IJC83_04780, partial [Oscillospiraceae bacterium]|nr:hypothetical protein [Oscillospiraceae bacterium]